MFKPSHALLFTVISFSTWNIGACLTSLAEIINRFLDDLRIGFNFKGKLIETPS